VRPVGWHTRSAASPRQITSRPSKLVASYPLNFEVLKTGYESLRQKSANTRRGRIEPRDGCIRSRWRLSRNSLLGKMVVLRSLRLHRPFYETRGDKAFKTRLRHSVRERCESGKMRDKKLVRRHHFKSASLEDRGRRASYTHGDGSDALALSQEVRIKKSGTSIEWGIQQPIPIQRDSCLQLAHRQRSLNHRRTSRIVCLPSSHSFQASYKAQNQRGAR
jgi:hypothetical protein